MQMFYPESHQLRSDLHELILQTHELTSTPEDKARLQEKIEEAKKKIVNKDEVASFGAFTASDSGPACDHCRSKWSRGR